MWVSRQQARELTERARRAEHHTADLAARNVMLQNLREDEANAARTVIARLEAEVRELVEEIRQTELHAAMRDESAPMTSESTPADELPARKPRLEVLRDNAIAAYEAFVAAAGA